MNTMKTALLLGLLTALFLVLGAAFGGRTGLLIGFALAVGTNFFSYWYSDRLVLSFHRARPLPPDQAPRVHAIVEQLCARAGLPKPKLYMLQEEAPNAFATGRNPDHAAVAVTQGILRILSDEELEGVLAHELSHVRNRDILIGTVAATLAGAVMMVAYLMRWAALFGGWGGRDERGNPFVLLVTALVAPIAAVLIQLAVSRSREFQADASGAALARNPNGLASALQKLETAAQRIPMRRANANSNHLFIVAPGAGAAFKNLFRTHPPTRERVRRLLGR